MRSPNQSSPNRVSSNNCLRHCKLFCCLHVTMLCRYSGHQERGLAETRNQSPQQLTQRYSNTLPHIPTLKLGTNTPIGIRAFVVQPVPLNASKLPIERTSLCPSSTPIQHTTCNCTLPLTLLAPPLLNQVFREALVSHLL